MRPNPAAGLLADVMPECFGIMLIGAELDWTLLVTSSALSCASALTAQQAAAQRQHLFWTDLGYHTPAFLSVVRLIIVSTVSNGLKKKKTSRELEMSQWQQTRFVWNKQKNWWLSMRTWSHNSWTAEKGSVYKENATFISGKFEKKCNAVLPTLTTRWFLLEWKHLKSSTRGYDNLDSRHPEWVNYGSKKS